MKETLPLPANHDGAIWHLIHRGRIHWMHRHDELEVNLVIRGTARYLVQDKRYDLCRHTQIWLFPGQEHVLIDQSPDYEMWILVFKRRLLQRVCRNESARVLLESKPKGNFCRQLSGHQTVYLGNLFSGVQSVEKEVFHYNTGLAYSLLSAWAAHLKPEQTTAGLEIHPSVEKAAQIIRDEAGPVPMNELARRSGLSVSRLSRLFRQQTGVSLGNYRGRQRVERFLGLYGQGRRRNMTEAALEAGFGSYPQFHRVFKQVMGHGPAEYRRRFLKHEGGRC